MSGNSQASPPPAVFCGKTHVAWFVAATVEQAPAKRDTGIPGLAAVGYRVTLEAQAVLPAVEDKRFIIVGQRGEGPEAGALGLQDWLPTRSGDACVLAFDAADFNHAKYAVYLGGGMQAPLVWRDCERFAACLRPEGGVDPVKVFSALAEQPPPLVTFFRLLSEYDRSVWSDGAALHAMSGYLANGAVPPLERRAVLAFYFAIPSAVEPEPLRELATGMLTLAGDLAAADQVASSGVVLERLRAFVESAPGTYACHAPHLAAEERQRVTQLLASETTGASQPTRASLHTWLFEGR